MRPFEQGELWEHRRQELQVFVRDVYEDNEQVLFFLGRVLPKSTDPRLVEHGDLFEFTLRRHGWSAEELLRDFRPLMRKVRGDFWQRLLEDHLEDLVVE